MGEGASFLWRCVVGDAQHSGNNLVCAMEGAGRRGESEQWWASDPLIELEMEFRRNMNRSSPVYVSITTIALALLLAGSAMAGSGELKDFSGG